jgi:chromosome partitioning protein
VFIDCPPSLGLLTLNALTASHGIIIPIQAEFLPLQGLVQLMETVAIVKRRLNPVLDILGVITTFYDPRKVLQRQVMDRIKERFGAKVYAATIRVNVALAEAPSVGQSIFEYQPDSNGAKDYMALCQEMLGERRE